MALKWCWKKEKKKEKYERLFFNLFQLSIKPTAVFFIELKFGIWSFGPL